MKRTLTFLLLSYRLRCALYLALLAALVASPPVAAQSLAPLATGFINGKVEANGTSMRYMVYVPRNYAPEKPWPVILFLHGSGADGHDGLRPVVGGLGWQLWYHAQLFPCLVVFPQQPSAAPWSGIYNDLALQALEAVVQKYNGDRSRLYLTGLSIGGDGTWKLAADHPDLFAAAMPIGGSGNPAQMAPALKSLPLWVFHGADDKVVSPRSDRAMVDALQAEGSSNVHYTEYPDVGHNCWDIVYQDPKVIQWLLAQKR